MYEFPNLKLRNKSNIRINLFSFTQDETYVIKRYKKLEIIENF